jgi:hypothetical protein
MLKIQLMNSLVLCQHVTVKSGMELFKSGLVFQCSIGMAGFYYCSRKDVHLVYGHVRKE